jgi:hypothetical protein
MDGHFICCCCTVFDRSAPYLLSSVVYIQCKLKDIRVFRILFRLPVIIHSIDGVSIVKSHVFAVNLRKFLCLSDIYVDYFTNFIL